MILTGYFRIWHGTHWEYINVEIPFESTIDLSVERLVSRSETMLKNFIKERRYKLPGRGVSLFVNYDNMLYNFHLVHHIEVGFFWSRDTYVIYYTVENKPVEPKRKTRKNTNV